LKKTIHCERVNLFEPNDHITMVVTLSGSFTVNQIRKAVFSAYEANEATMSRVVLEDDGTVKVYYGAADTVIAMAEAKVDELVELCLAGGPR
jgi:hypothetical protein